MAFCVAFPEMAYFPVLYQDVPLLQELVYLACCLNPQAEHRALADCETVFGKPRKMVM